MTNDKKWASSGAKSLASSHNLTLNDFSLSKVYIKDVRDKLKEKTKKDKKEQEDIERSTLLKVIQRGDIVSVKTLLNNGFYHKDAIIEATKQGHYHIVKILYPITLENEIMELSLIKQSIIEAASRGYIKIVKLLWEEVIEWQCFQHGQLLYEDVDFVTKIMRATAKGTYSLIDGAPQKYILKYITKKFSRLPVFYDM